MFRELEVWGIEFREFTESTSLGRLGSLGSLGSLVVYQESRNVGEFRDSGFSDGPEVARTLCVLSWVSGSGGIRLHVLGV